MYVPSELQMVRKRHFPAHFDSSKGMGSTCTAECPRSLNGREVIWRSEYCVLLLVF